MSHSRMSRQRTWRRASITGENILCSLFAPLLAVVIRDDAVLTSGGTGITNYLAVSVLATILALASLRIGNELPYGLCLPDPARVITASAAAVAVTVVVSFSVTRMEGVPRSLPAIHFLVLVFLVLASRVLVRSLTKFVDRRAGIAKAPAESVVVVGADQPAWLLLNVLDLSGGARPKIAAVLDIGSDRIGQTIAGHRIVGACSTAPDFLHEMQIHGVRIDRFLVASPEAAPGTANWHFLSRCCGERGIAIEYVISGLDQLTTSSALATGAIGPGEAPVPADAPRLYWRAKRSLDIILASTALLFVFPLMIVIGVGVLLAFGSPVLFWQERLGQGSKPIRIHKFRTMRQPLDCQGRRLPESERATALGRLLRASRLDELPQLVDILRGDMSLIGPRPLLLADQPTDPRRRLSVRPGLTGWAQVRGGRAILPEEKNTLDVWYIDHANIWLDLKIILLTATMFFSRGDSELNGMEVSNLALKCRASHSEEASAGTTESNASQPLPNETCVEPVPAGAKA